MSTARKPAAAVVETKAGWHLPNELVVALAYERVVLQQLESWEASPDVQTQDRDARLGLLRATLDPSGAVRHLEQVHPEWAQIARADAQREGYTPSDLDILVRCLRALSLFRLPPPVFGSRFCSHTGGRHWCWPVEPGGGSC